MTDLYVLDASGTPQLAADAISYGQSLLDPTRNVGSDIVAIPNGQIWIQTEFVGVDFDASGRLWQTVVEWSSMLGHSFSFARWATLADAQAGHADLLAAMNAAAAALNAT